MYMNQIIISTDSGMNPENKKYMIPGLVMDSSGKEYYDTKSLEDTIPSIQMEDIFKGFKEGKIYQTSAPKLYDYYQMFHHWLEQGLDILHLSVSEHISSSSLNISMKMIEELKEKYPNRIEGVNSKTAGSGGAVLCSYANRLLEEKRSLLELKEELEKLKTKVVGSHFISSCKGYVRSGRVPKGLKVADLLGFRYRVDSNAEGKLVPKKIYRGKIDMQAMKYMKDLVNEENIEEYRPEYLALLHMPLKEIDYKRIKEYLQSFHYFQNIIELPFYGTISAYGVEDQLGLGIIKK